MAHTTHPSRPIDARTERAVELARRLLVASSATETKAEHRRGARLDRLLTRPGGRELLFALSDEVLRIESASRSAKRLAAVVDRPGALDGLGAIDRVLLRAGALAAPRLPALVMPLVKRRIRAETRGVVLPADEPELGRYLSRRSGQGVHLNVNPLGEAILSDAEADHRFAQLCELIGRDDVDYVSAKISALVAHLDLTAFDHTIDRICARLRDLYRAADAATPRTFVNLDMEEYRDLELTLRARS
ncbi:MAG: hypothetical protein R2705_06840 [Ilumatobacteraceae bacterium]